jgi:SEC-C motif-containing protein
MVRCPCGSGAELEACCGPVISGESPAPTAEALMRSRYTAFVRGEPDHIINTYAREKRAAIDRPTVTGMFGSVDWIGLEILNTTGGGETDSTGTVEFAARFRKDGGVRVHRERSRFRREAGRWVYVDGDVHPDTGPATFARVGRNQPCPCGSGRKFKKCCGA